MIQHPAGFPFVLRAHDAGPRSRCNSGACEQASHATPRSGGGAQNCSDTIMHRNRSKALLVDDVVARAPDRSDSRRTCRADDRERRCRQRAAPPTRRCVAPRRWTACAS